MPEVLLPSGVRVRFPDTLQVAETPSGSGVAGTRRMPMPSGPIPVSPPGGASGFSEDLLDAMSSQDLEVLEKFELQPRTLTGGPVRSGAIPLAAAAAQSISIEATVGEEEDAVMLTEQEGMYSWHIRRAGEPVEGGAATRSIPSGAKTFRFDVDVYPADAAPTPASRGFLTDLALDGIRAWVLKFAAKAAAGEALKQLERNSRTGFVFLDGHNTETWRFDVDPAPLVVPELLMSRPIRILLLIHGTFSSTVGGFGAMTGTPWGQEFLDAAMAAYDTVVGFDHPTLRETPLENATSLLRLLEKFIPAGTQIDVITHSRGGLVFRSLAEMLLPSSPWQPQIGRVVMVASPNAGTLLAEPENWKTLIDLYTNIAVGACRLLSLMPQATAVSGILKELFSSLGEFLKYLAQDAVGQGGIPGLDAMRTSGAFVKQLNETQPGQPAPGALAIYAITSEFTPNLSGPEAEPKELPRRLLLASAGEVINELMKEANDLVVNTSSMVAIDSLAGNFITDQFRFGATGRVYHTTYFIRPETINALTRWLRLEAPAASATPPVGSRQRTNTLAVADVPALVDTDITLLDAADFSGHALAYVRAFSPSYAVIRRRDPVRDYYYAFQGEELLGQLEGWIPTTVLGDALHLHEWMESPSQTVSTVCRVTGNPGVKTSNRGVVFAGDLPVGVVPSWSDFIPNEDLAGIAHSIAQPAASPDVNVAIRRTMPTFGPVRVVRGGSLKYGFVHEGDTADSVPDFPGSPAPASAPPPASVPPTPTLGQAPPLPASASPGGGRLPRGGGRLNRVGGPPPMPPAVTPVAPQATQVPTPRAEPPKVALHFLAEMPCEVKTGKECSVEVSISRETLTAVTGMTAGLGGGEATESKQLLIQIIPRAQFSIEDDRRKVEIPPPGKPATYYFDLIPTHEGDGEIWIVIRQDQAPICTLVLQPKVVASPGVAQRRLHVETEAGEPEELNAPMHQLRIMDLRNGGEVRYRFEIYSPTLSLLKEYESKTMNEDVSGYVNRLYADIESRWLSTAGDQKDFAAEMRAFGSDLFENLFPRELQQVLWDHRDDIQSIMAISAEPFIPWEMMLIKEPGTRGLGDGTRFLAEMGLVRWLYAAEWPPLHLRIREGRARYVIPQYPMKDYVLPEALQEADDLRSRFGATSVEAQPTPVRELLGEKSFDLLHFACHAGAEGAGVSDGKILLQGRIEGTGGSAKYIPATIDAKTVEAYADLKGADGTRAVIVLNACQSGRAGYKLASTGGFAQSFLKGGAGAFVGSLWSVGDQPARNFTKEFYEQLQAGVPVAQAASLARLKAKTAGDATWLAYAVYAHPNAVLSRT